ncbi:MAG: carboxypeptidase-like regulatory domain-containing protein [Bacteroidales bacterium]
MKLIKTLLILFTPLILLGSANTVYSQNASIRGFVYEKKTGEPVIYTNVYLFRTTYGSVTDVNGYYSISNIPPGTYTLMVTYLGYDTVKETVELKKGDILTKKLFLEQMNIMLTGASISAERQEAKTETKTSVVKITPKQIKQIPTIGGQADLAQYLQVLPGVIFTGDQGGQLYIRGGSPVQNKVLLDGMIVYNPFHSIGLFSVFETDIIRNADIYTGGYGAEYGGRISSVMDITTRDGNKKQFAGKVGASVFGANLLVEGPIKKQVSNDAGSSSFILTFKNSYLKESSKVFYEYVDENGLPFNFTDLYGKVSFNAANGSKVNFFGFNFTDQVDYSGISDFKWNSSGGGTNFVVIPDRSTVLIQGNFSYSKYKMTLEENDGLPRSSEINGFNSGLNFTYFINKDEIKYGVELLGFKTVFDFFNSVGRSIDQTQNTTELAGFIKYKATRGKFLIEPGMRIQYYASLANVSLEPRLAMKYNATDHLRFKFAGGLYSQNLLSASSDRDVVNLFFGFLSGPDNLPENFDGKTVKHNLQKARHLVLGMEFDPVPHMTINIEGYYKQFPQLTNINRNKVFDDTGEYYEKPDNLKKDYIIENGEAKGVDFSLKYDFKGFHVWTVYSLAYVDRYDGITNYVPHFDRRHNINITTSYNFGSDNQWGIDLRWNFGSGFPFTKTGGYYGMITFGDGIMTDYTTVNEDLGLIYGKLNDGRLPTYHRMDVNFKRIWKFSEDSKLEVDLSVTNVYDRKNIFYYNRINSTKVYQLPVLPSLGMNLTF